MVALEELLEGRVTLDLELCVEEDFTRERMAGKAFQTDGEERAKAERFESVWLVQEAVCNPVSLELALCGGSGRIGHWIVQSLECHAKEHHFTQGAVGSPTG